MARGAGTASGAPIGKINGAGGIGGAAFRRRGEVYPANSFRSNRGSNGPLGRQRPSRPLQWPPEKSLYGLPRGFGLTGFRRRCYLSPFPSGPFGGWLTPHFGTMNLELNDEQTEALIRLLSRTIDGDRYPLNILIVVL